MERFTPELFGITVLALFLTFLGGCLWVARVQIWELGRALFHRYARVDYVNEAPAESDDDRISPRPGAVMENGEIGKMVTLTQAALDGMIAAAKAEGLHEGAARAVGTLAGRGINPATERAKALIAVGIEGRRYTRLKPIVDSAQAAAQAEQALGAPAPEPRRTPLAGRPIAPDLEFAGELPE